MSDLWRIGPRPADGVGRAPEHVEALRRWLLERGYELGPGDTVTSQVAAMLLGNEEQTLRCDRSIYGRIPHQRIGRRVRYRLADLAAVWLDIEQRLLSTKAAALFLDDGRRWL